MAEEIGSQGWRGLAAWGRQRELGELDALMWRTERHPANSWTGLVVLTLDTAPSFERMSIALEWLVRMVPRFTERVVEPVLPLGPAMWAQDPDFDFSYHVRHVSLPEPGSEAQLLELAQRVALTPLDRSRPPWVTTLVDGLEGGRAALLLQVHHVLMDGAAVTQLLQRALSPTREERDIGEFVDTPRLPELSRAGATRAEIVRQARQVPGLAPGLTRRLGRSLARPRQTAEYARSMAKVLAPPPPNPSRVLSGGRRRNWRFGKFECQLADLKAAGRAVGGSVNDTFVSILLGGLRGYCADLGEDLADIPISMPVSMRLPDQAMGGNKFAGAFFAVPSGIADPVERIQELHRRVEAVRGEPALDFLASLTPALNRVPSPVAASLLGNINQRAVLTTSSWPGVTADVYAAGAKMDGMWVFAPLPGTSVTGAMCTHSGRCCIAVNVDGDVIEDPPRLWTHIQSSLDEVLALAPGRSVSA